MRTVGLQPMASPRYKSRVTDFGRPTVNSDASSVYLGSKFRVPVDDSSIAQPMTVLGAILLVKNFSCDFVLSDVVRPFRDTRYPRTAKLRLLLSARRCELQTPAVLSGPTNSVTILRHF
jgi:hypothetical protein